MELTLVLRAKISIWAERWKEERAIILIALEIILISYLTFNIVRIVQRYKKASSHQYPHPLERFKHALPSIIKKSIIINILMFDVKMIYYGIITLFYKETIQENLNQFSYAKTSQFKVLSIVLVIIMLAESVLVHILVHHFIISRATVEWVNIIPWSLHLLNVYVLLLLFAQSRAMKALPHTIEEESLTIHNGILGTVKIPFTYIESINKAKDIGLGEKENPKTFYAYIRMDTAQYEITLKQEVQRQGINRKKGGYNKVVVRADEPQPFYSTIQKIIADKNGKITE